MLSNYRREIDIIDDQLVDLLSRRMTVVEGVAIEKVASDKDVNDPDRESMVIERLVGRINRCNLNITDRELESIFNVLFAVSKARQSTIIANYRASSN